MEEKKYREEENGKLSRRDFLKTGLAGAAAVGLGAVSLNAQAQQAKGATPVGEVRYANQYSSFGQVGGDVATLLGGMPFISPTVYEALTFMDVDEREHPAVAKSWKIAKDWSYVDFFLRDDVKFHNGDPVTVEDVKYSFDVFMAEDSKYYLRNFFRRMFKKIEIVGPHQVRFHCSGPFPGMFVRISTWGCAILPKKYREALGPKAFADKPIGAGPFRWVDYKQDVYFTVEAVPNHYRKTPEFKTLKILYVPEASTRLAMLKTGEADIVDIIGPHIPQVKADPNLRVILNKHVWNACLSFCDIMDASKPSPFHDIRVRKAASYAINRKAICEKVLFGSAEPWGEVLSPMAMGNDPTIKPDPYDPKTGKALLAEAGYPQGFETAIHAQAHSKPWIEAVAANLAEVGIKAKIELYERGAWVKIFQSKKLRGLAEDRTWYNAERQPAADVYDFVKEGMPWCVVTNPEIDKVVTEGTYAITDEEMIDAGKKISKAIRDSRIRLVLWSMHTAFGVNQKIAYWKPKVGAIPSTDFEYIRLKR